MSFSEPGQKSSDEAVWDDIPAVREPVYSTFSCAETKKTSTSYSTQAAHMADAGDITQLLVAAREGESSAIDRLFPLVYDQLRGMAHGRIRRHSPGQTLNTTGLVHEAYLKLIDQTRAQWNDRGHFLAVASIAMRQILVDYARRRTAGKRGGRSRDVTLDDLQAGVVGRAEEILAIDEALGSLAELSERLSKIVELRFFGGLSVAETAEVLEVSERTVKRDWRKARAFLYRTLSVQAES